MKTSNIATDCQTSEVILCGRRQICRKRFFSDPGLIAGLTVLILIMLAAIITPVAVNVDPNEVAIADRLKGPNLNHPFGTDEFGRDLMTRVLYGARVSLLVGGTVVLLSCVLGMAISIYASYFKILDHILMRICEGLIAISGVLLAIAFMAALETDSLDVIIALTIVYTPSVVRIVRSNTSVTRSLPYVEAVRVQGADGGHILWRLILLSIISPLTVQVSFIFAQAIISEAPLSFLRAGIPAPATSRGNILQDSKQVPQKMPWTVLFPGLAVVFCVFSLSPLGGRLRDHPDPRTARRKKG